MEIAQCQFSYKCPHRIVRHLNLTQKKKLCQVKKNEKNLDLLFFLCYIAYSVLLEEVSCGFFNGRGKEENRGSFGIFYEF